MSLRPFQSRIRPIRPLFNITIRSYTPSTRLRGGANTTSSDPNAMLDKNKRMGSNPQSNQPDSLARKARADTPNTDAQSSASQDEDKSGDAHPAKQPDPQSQPERTTGIGGGEGVEGGRNGVGERSDR